MFLCSLPEGFLPAACLWLNPSDRLAYVRFSASPRGPVKMDGYRIKHRSPAGRPPPVFKSACCKLERHRRSVYMLRHQSIRAFFPFAGRCPCRSASISDGAAKSYFSRVRRTLSGATGSCSRRGCPVTGHRNHADQRPQPGWGPSCIIRDAVSLIYFHTSFERYKVLIISKPGQSCIEDKGRHAVFMQAVIARVLFAPYH